MSGDRVSPLVASAAVCVTDTARGVQLAIVAQCVPVYVGRQLVALPRAVQHRELYLWVPAIERLPGVLRAVPEHALRRRRQRLGFWCEAFGGDGTGTGDGKV